MLKSLILCISLLALTTFDGYAQTWNQKANVPTIARHRATSFSIGNKGYVGMGHLNTVSNILFEDLWEYNPANNTWTQKADFGGGLRYHMHAFVINGKAYVGTGRDISSYQDDNWEYNPQTNTWTAKADIPGPNRRGTVSFVVNDLGYVGSGLTSSGGSSTSNNFYAYDPTTDSWSSVASFPGASRNSAVAFTIGNKGYMGTGDIGGWNATNDFWEYDPATDIWTQKADVGDSVRRQATGFALDGKGYIGTGHQPNIDDDVGDFWRYNPVSDIWVPVEDFLGVSRRYAVAFVIEQRAFIAMGTNGINFNDLWEYNPNYIAALPPLLEDLSVKIQQQGASDLKVQVNNINGVHNDLALLISNMNGEVIQRTPLVSGNVEIALNSLPANCIYRVVNDGVVLKSGKVKADKVAIVTGITNSSK